jgi:RNA polymerase sigma-B factor
MLAGPPRPDRVRDDRTLFRRFVDEDDPVDREQVVEHFLPLARHLAGRYAGQEPFDDLFQVACLGLVKAVDRYDPDRGTAFSSYAVPTIAGEIRRHFRDRTWSMRVPRDLQELSLRVDRHMIELAVELHRRPAVEEVAREMGVSVEDVLEALQASAAYRSTSLEAPRATSDDPWATVADTLGSDDARLALAEDRAVLSRLMRRIPPRERRVLCLRFFEDLTQEEIGDRVGLSQMQVSRIIRQALARLRSTTTSDAERTAA